MELIIAWIKLDFSNALMLLYHINYSLILWNSQIAWIILSSQKFKVPKLNTLFLLLRCFVTPKIHAFFFISPMCCNSQMTWIFLDSSDVLGHGAPSTLDQTIQNCGNLSWQWHDWVCPELSVPAPDQEAQ